MEGGKELPVMISDEDFQCVNKRWSQLKSSFGWQNVYFNGKTNCWNLKGCKDLQAIYLLKSQCIV